MEALSASEQGLGSVLYEQIRSLSCRTRQICEDGAEGKGGRETFADTSWGDSCAARQVALLPTTCRSDLFFLEA